MKFFILALLSVTAIAQTPMFPPAGKVLVGLNGGGTSLQTPAYNTADMSSYSNNAPANALPSIFGMYMTLCTIPDVATWNTTGEPLMRAAGRNYYAYEIGVSLVVDNYVGGVEQSTTPCDPQVAAGNYDQQIQDLITDVKGVAPRPVYIRIGQECNGPWFGYTPSSFISSYQRIVTAFRTAGVTNASFIWNINPEGSASFMNWYPGDSYVDWMSINFVLGNSDFTNSETTTFFTQAASHNKPVALGEVAPAVAGYTVIGQGPKYWSTWFAPFFSTIMNGYSSQIGMLIYSNVDFTSPPYCSAGNCGINGSLPNNHLTEDAYVYTKWVSQLTGDSRYILGADKGALLTAVGVYTAPAAIYSGPTTAMAQSAVTLNGSTSTSPQGGTAYSWSLVSGPAQPAITPAVSTASASFPVPGTYNMKLSVTDSVGLFSSAAFAVTVSATSNSGNVQPVPVTFTFPPSATVALLTAYLANGATATQTCSASPCSFSVDIAQGNALLKIDYKNAGGVVIASTGNMPLKLT